MQNKEIEENTFKVSIPLITNAELNEIDNNLDSFVNQFIKQVIHDKDLLVAQHIIKRQKEYIDQLETKVKELETDKQEIINRLESDIPKITKTLQDGKHCDDYSRCRLKAYRTKTKEILRLYKEKRKNGISRSDKYIRR